MASERTIEALRALAERPGTEHEGIVARQMLERLSRVTTEDDFTPFRRWLRREITLDELVQAMNPTRLTPEEQLVVDEADKIKHRASIRQQIHDRFRPGDRIALGKRRGVVAGYDYGWNSICLKLNGNMWPRAYVVYDESGWLIRSDTQTREPLSHPLAAG